MAVLLGHGVGPEQVVGLFAERSAALVVGILGMLRRGGAYLPLDPGYPRERLAYLLEDSGARLVVVDEVLRGCLPGEGRDRDLAARRRWRAGGFSVPLRSDPDHLAYVIYTSGSTGPPKGVAVLTAAIAVRLVTGGHRWSAWGPATAWAARQPQLRRRQPGRSGAPCSPAPPWW